MSENELFLDRFKRYAMNEKVEVKEMELHPLEIEWDKTIFKEQKKNDELTTVRLLSIKYVDDEIRKSLKGNGEAYMGGSDEHMAPDQYEKLDINIPSDATDVKQVWKLYDEWLIKWTPAKDLRDLVGEPIREEKGQNSCRAR